MDSDLANGIAKALDRPDVKNSLAALGVKKVLVAADSYSGAPCAGVYCAVSADTWQSWGVPRSADGWKRYGIAGRIALRTAPVLHGRAAWFPNLFVALALKLCRDNGINIYDADAALRFQSALNRVVADGRVPSVSRSDGDREMQELYGWWQPGSSVGWAELAYIPETGGGMPSNATIDGVAWAMRETLEDVNAKADEIRRHLSSSPLVLTIV